MKVCDWVCICCDIVINAAAVVVDPGSVGRVDGVDILVIILQN